MQYPSVPMMIIYNIKTDFSRLYFINTKYTAITRQKKAAKWFQRMGSFPKNMVENTTKTTRVMTS